MDKKQQNPIILELLSDDENEAMNEFQEQVFLEEEENIASMSENVKRIQTKLNQIEVALSHPSRHMSCLKNLLLRTTSFRFYLKKLSWTG